MPGIIGKKIGMAQIFEEDGRVVPVTYIFCDQNNVCQIKSKEKDGVDAVVLGFDKRKKEKKTKRYNILRQFSGEIDKKKGESITVELFEGGEKVTVTGKSKGKGFQGPVRRHNFRTARKSHGTKEPRHGSTGAVSGRPKPGLKMAGRMGNEQVTLRDRKIVCVLPSENIIAIKGAIPGAKDSYVLIKKQG
jgi:large subunit ribosomal protein L3